MKQCILLSLVFLLISGCGVSTKTPAVEINSTEFPSTPTASATSIPATETLLPSPSPTQAATIEAEQIIFQDNFDGLLAKNWQWLKEDPVNWSLETVRGSLQINIGRGYLNLGNASNILLTPAPEGNFEIETRLTFPAGEVTHFAGLLLYESEKNFIQAGHAYCHPVNRCVGKGVYLENYAQGKLLQEPYLAQKYNEDSISLRLVYKDGVLTFLTSPNGIAWFRIYETQVGFNILQVGLVTGQNLEDPSPVLFDYFKITALK
jgi:beta-xylosidase